MGTSNFRALSYSNSDNPIGLVFSLLGLEQNQDSWTRVHTVMMDRRLVVTAKGYFGLASKNAMQGDVVCILLGCTVPVILRPTGDGTYWLVGESYIHGFMEGEAIAETGDGVYGLESFQIS
jgi:hypothetical protein